MPKVRASSGTIGTMSLPMSLSRSSFDSMRTNTIVVDALRPSVPVWNSSKMSPKSMRRGHRARSRRFGTEPPQRLAALAQVLASPWLSSAGR